MKTAIAAGVLVAGIGIVAYPAVANATIDVTVYRDCLAGWPPKGTTENLNLALDSCCYMAGGIPDAQHNCQESLSLSPGQTNPPTKKPALPNPTVVNPGLGPR
jgi:hypothetical protein